MTQKLEDLRVRRTRKLLKRALVELTIEKGFVNITVSDIAERAMVNRSTFYRHYVDKYDLLSQYIEEVIALIHAQEGEPSQENGPDQTPTYEGNRQPYQPSVGLVRILRHVQTNADFYRVLLGENGAPALCAQSFRRFIKQQFRHMLPDHDEQADLSRPPIDLSVNYILHAGIGAILWWLENDQPCTPEQFAVWLNQFSTADMSVSLGLDESKSVSLRTELKNRSQPMGALR
jgi:AcrR family transcriptional regulator